MSLAPKKKKAEAAADKGAAAPSEPTSGQLFNIFIEKSDPKLLPDHCYPDWLWGMDKPSKTYGELSLMFVYGQGIENATFTEYRQFLRKHRKIVIKLNNLRLKRARRKNVKPIFWDV
ncbi:unnamed protein product [Vitrella brassicaformis CCMP3155]|uniref:Large ribosomal subunit protein mL54 n=1 Tax=Vitrella brassicaformis (strain CCMP3155) TaxID=1169540 RepID=A0A0G4ETJ2_VITBC|nr:unnamed protein product [Vitrella brassicaformis CCMP3155]|eukprot:CEM01631.1 unnamed protein product [Vitrella brassicaformis CCMP3155]